MDGHIRLPKSRLEILESVNECYDVWFKIWAETMIPKLLYQPKWFKTEGVLAKGDMVYFPRKESALDVKWIIGMVEEWFKGSTRTIRRVNSGTPPGQSER